MFSFHKPKVFRSANGCCICKAKSSSSRFTDSKRYEPYFEKCFGLEEDRAGEICNACVLLVKRFIKLPAGSNRNWNHVVDARCGPGIKSMVRAKKLQKPDENAAEVADDFKKKHVYQRKNKRTPLTDKVVRNRNPSIDISPFLDMSFWKREKICCGTIFRAPNGEVAVDVRYISPCEACKNSKNPVFPHLQRMREEEALANASAPVVKDDVPEPEVAPEVVPEEDSEPEAPKREQGDAQKEEEEESSATELAMEVDDEGFFDRQAVSPECAAVVAVALNM